MNPTAIYSKTGKGVQEASGKTSNLSRADRAVLSAIDGKTNVAALHRKFEKTPRPKFDQLMERLDREGYIREASQGATAAPPPSRPSAPASAKPMDVTSDLDFTGVFGSPISKTSPSLPKGPPVDLAAKARAEAERRSQEEALSYKAREAAQAKAKAEAEARERETASVRSRAEAEAKVRAEAEAKLKAAQEMALRIAAEEKARGEKARAEAEAKEKARSESEAEARKRIEDEARKRGEEDARKRKLEEEARKRKEEEERKRREEEEARKRKEQEERKRREEEEARKRKEEEERKRREEEEARKRKEEEERRRKEEEERKRKEEEERKRREEEEARRRKEEEERRRKEEEERKRREEEERKAREAEERRRREEEEARRRKEEEERKRREEEEARRRRQEEEARKRREEEEARRRKQEEEAKARAPSGDAFADSLLADLDNFAQRDETERKAEEEAGRKAKEKAERAQREQQERAQREEQERKQREEEERARRDRERRARDLEESGVRRTADLGGDSRAKRRLAAIVAADVVGYSRLMGIDEEGTLTRFKRMMRELIQPKVEEHDGRIVKTAGDGMLMEFPSVVDAVRFAVQVQTAVANDEADVTPVRQIAFRMGINLGDIIGEDNDVYGDGVNVAARLEQLADKGGICIAGVVYDQIRDKVTYSIEALGEQKLKNIPRPVRAYKIKGDWETTQLRRAIGPGSLPHPAVAKVAKAADEEVVVRDEDLDMDEVRRDEQALTKEALRAQRRREREAKRKKAAEVEAPIKIRRRRKWGKPLAIGLLVALVAAVGAVQVMPVETGKYAKAASAALGRRVTIGSARLSLLSGLEVKLQGVRIGDIRIETVRMFPELLSLLDERKAFGRVELIGALVPQNELGNVLLGKLGGSEFRVARVEATQLRTRGPFPLPPLDVEAVLGGDGSVRSVTLHGPDKLEVKLMPVGASVTLEGSAGSLVLPFAPQVTLTDFSLKGIATREGLALSEWEGGLLDGILSGSARISWGPTWSAEGKLKIKNINAAVFAPALLSEGKANGTGSYAMRGAVPAKLGADARIVGEFTVSKGVLGSFDLSRSIRTAGKETQGRTLFAELTGRGVYNGGAVALRDVNVAAGALNAGATADIGRDGALSGRIVADVRTAGHVLRSTIILGGTVKQPEVKK